MFVKLDRVLKKIENGLSFIAMLLLLGFMLLGTVNVCARFLFNWPIIGALEFSQLMMAGSFLLALASCQAKKQHTAVTDLVSRYPAKVKVVVEFTMLFIALILFGIMTWRSAAAVISMWNYGELIEAMRIPAAPFFLVLPIGALVLCLELISQMIQLVANGTKRGK
jgi:TRAP-type transport system small permease protein